MKKLLAIAATALLLSAPVQADDISLHIGSYTHAWDDDRMNEQSFNIGGRYEDFAFGYIDRNVFDNHSVYAYWNPRVYKSEHFDFGFALGAQTGWEDDACYDGWGYEDKFTIGDHIAPLVGLTAEAKVGDVGIETVITPMLVRTNFVIHF
ncbi:antimicrobial peptide resistance and lipid A acyl ation protein PagP [Vibrio phage K567]